MYAQELNKNYLEVKKVFCGRIQGDTEMSVVQNKWGMFMRIVNIQGLGSNQGLNIQFDIA